MLGEFHRRSIILGLLWIASIGLGVCRGETLEIGSPAPDFRLPGVDGKTYSLESFRDAEILVVVFTCNHCPTAQAYEGRIQQLAADYKDKKVALVAISPNDPQAVRLDELGYSDLGDSFEDMKIRAKDRGFKFPLPLRRREPEGLPGLRPRGHPARIRLRPTAEAPLHGPDRQLRQARAGHVPRHPQRHRGPLGGQARAGGEDEGLRLLDQVGRQARVGQEIAGDLGQGGGRP